MLDALNTFSQVLYLSCRAKTGVERRLLWVQTEKLGMMFVTFSGVLSVTLFPADLIASISKQVCLQYTCIAILDL